MFTTLPPKIIDLEQRTPEWFAWRRGEDLPDKGPRITASMVPQIIGASPWGNAYDLWLELTGRKPGKASNIAMQRGIDLEPIARAAYTAATGVEVRDVCVEHPTIPWVAASLDGYTLFGDGICEIKCPGAADHATAILNQVPGKYIPQCQWQLFCCPPAKVNDYWSYDGIEKKGALVKVFPNQDYQKFLYEVASEFRECVIQDIPPNGVEFSAIAMEVRQLYIRKKEIEEAYKNATAKLTPMVPSYAKSASFGGVTVSKSSTDGRIDYDALIMEQGIPPEIVEKHRKKSKEGDSYRVSVNLDAVVPTFGQSKDSSMPATDLAEEDEMQQAIPAVCW